MSEKTTRQHYVFQAYLQAWIDKAKNMIWCIKEGKVFCSQPANVAFENNFYCIEPLNNNEFDILEQITRNMNSTYIQYLVHHIDNNLSILNAEIISSLLQNHISNHNDTSNLADLQQYISNNIALINAAKNNAYENFYCQSENELLSVFKDINSNGLTNIDINTNQNLVLNICIQYFRTKAMREKIKKDINDYFGIKQLEQNNISVDKIAQYIIWPFPETSCSTIFRHSKYQLYIINNTTDTPFITCDQPVINSKANDNKSFWTESVWEKDLELYYPISPTKAILISQTDPGTEWSDEMVKKFNSKMIDASYMLVFTNSQEQAEILAKEHFNTQPIGSNELGGHNK